MTVWWKVITNTHKRLQYQKNKEEPNTKEVSIFFCLPFNWQEKEGLDGGQPLFQASILKVFDTHPLKSTVVVKVILPLLC